MEQNVIEAIEQGIRTAKSTMDFGAALERLKTNRDFKEVVLKGYFEAEAIRLVHLKGDPDQQDPESQRSILSQIDAISGFSGYMNACLLKANMAAKNLADAEEELAEINNDQGAN